jgi:hypothetical protein
MRSRSRNLRSRSQSQHLASRRTFPLISRQLPGISRLQHDPRQHRLDQYIETALECHAEGTALRLRCLILFPSLFVPFVALSDSLS